MTNEPKPTDTSSTPTTGPAPTVEPTAIAPGPGPGTPVPPSPLSPTATTGNGALAASGPSPWVLRADLALVVLLLVFSFFLASFTATNSDNWLQLALGRQISDGKYQFGVDQFSWATQAAEGKSAPYFVHHSWLYSWVLYKLHQVGGGSGLVIAKAIFFTVAIALLCLVGWNSPSRWLILFCLIMAVLAMSTRLFLQPIVVSYFLLTVTLFFLHRAGVFAAPSQSSGSEASDTPGGGEERIAVGIPALPQEARCLWWLPPLFALWANLDAWFILGPLVIGLCWAATGLSRWFRGSTGEVPGQFLGIIFGAGLLACVVNPHHVRVFQFPPELAYLILSFTDPLHLPLPDAIFGAGRTLQELAKAGLGEWIPLTISPLSPRYWDQRMGMNIAGLALFPLLLLGLLSFALTMLAPQQKQAPTLQICRFMVWLVFALMALTLFRIIPFFALVAAPLTAMTLGEFLAWQELSNAQAAERRDRGLRVARFVSIPLMLTLIGLAWPGWLHGNMDYNSRTRVAWELRPDPSAMQAAELLQDLHQQEPLQNVFNAGPEFGNYLAWYAPGVRYYLDTRFGLFTSEVGRYVKARQVLTDGKGTVEDWRKLFVENNVNQVAMEGLLLQAEPSSPILAARWWKDPDQWRPRYLDSKVMIFSWAGEKKSWPAGTTIKDLNRAAFGEVPASRRAPEQGFVSPPPLTGWDLFFEGSGHRPVGTLEFLALQRFYEQSAYDSSRAGGRSLFPTYVALSSVCALPPVNIPAPADFISYGAMTYYAQEWIRAENTREFGPPALPILMMRAARRAVADNPRDGESHAVVVDACRILREFSEDRWIGYSPSPQFSHPSALRDRVRNLQMTTGKYYLGLLQQDNYLAHLILFEEYVGQNFLDLALEHRLLAEKVLEGRLNAGKEIRLPGGQVVPMDAKVREKFFKSFRDSTLDMERNVKQRRAKFNDIKGSKLDRAIKALSGEYQDFREGRIQKSSLGLAKEALDLLSDIDPNSLKPEERLPYTRTTFELLLAIGRADMVAANLKKSEGLKSQEPQVYAQYQLLSGAALGNYQAVDEALETMEQAFRDNVKAREVQAEKVRNETVPTYFAAGTQQFVLHLAITTTLKTAPALMGSMQSSAMQIQARNDQCNAITLRGIFALEAGNTKQARRYFESALAAAGSENDFSDRPIATRYLKLLKDQQR